MKEREWKCFTQRNVAFMLGANVEWSIRDCGKSMGEITSNVTIAE